MMYHVIVEDIAIDDIQRNARWWSNHHSHEQALAWYETATAAIYTLATDPGRHAISPENDEFEFEIRELLFGIGSRPSYRAAD